MSSSIRSTRRVVAAAAGIGITLATLTGATTSFAAGHPVPSPHIVVPGAGVTVTSGTPIGFPEKSLRGEISLAVPNFTINDPGVIVSGSVVRVDLGGATGVTFDAAHQPVVTVSGAGVIASKPVVAAGGASLTFTISKSDDATPAKFALSGVFLDGPATTIQGQISASVSYSDATTTNNPTPVRTFPFGAVTHLFPAVYGPSAADTAATLFRAAIPVNAAPTSIVLATDFAPQDAESASYLAAAMGTGIVLTNSTTLSSAVSDVLDDYGSITTVYIVGGTSVVSDNVANALAKRQITVTRLAGTTAYQTNQTVVNTASPNAQNSNVTIDYSAKRFNTTSGMSSPTTTATTSGKTAIVASGDMRSFSDGIASGALSYKDGIPLLLTGPQMLDNGVRQLLISGGYTQVILLGGPAAISDTVFTELTTSVDKGGAGVTAFRIAGGSFTETASLLASFEVQTGAAPAAGPAPAAPNGLGFATTDQGNAGEEGGVLIARGSGFQDALAAGPYAGGVGNTPILLTSSATDLGPALGAYLRGVGGANVFSIQALGGPLSVTATVQQAAVDAEVAGIPTTK